MYSAVVLLIFFAGLALGERPEVQVWLPAVTNSNVDHAFRRAKMVVSEAYAEIGVNVVWRSAHAAPLGCSVDSSGSKIVVAFPSITPAGVTKEALAFATPFATAGPCVIMLMDRIRPLAETNPLSTGFLLGNALAHEMGHVLQRVIRHSDTGLMKAHWSRDEIMNMTKCRLHFPVYDADLIMRALVVKASPKSVSGKMAVSLNARQSLEFIEEVK